MFMCSFWLPLALTHSSQFKSLMFYMRECVCVGVGGRGCDLNPCQLIQLKLLRREMPELLTGFPQSCSISNVIHSGT